MSTFVCFSVDGGDYEVAIAAVQEIAALGAVVALPGAWPGVAGLSELHGQIATVIDLAERVSRSAPERPRMLVLGGGDRRRVVLRIDAATVADLPSADDAAQQRRFTRGRTRRSGRTRWIIDSEAVVGASTDDGVSPSWELDVLLAQRGSHHVGLPIADVDAVVRVAGSDVPEAGTPLPGPRSGSGPTIVVAAGAGRVALRCDRLLGQRTVVVHPLRVAPAAGDAYLGAALVEPGRIALVLDPAGLRGR